MSKAATVSPSPARRRQADRVALSDRRLMDAAIELIVKVGIHGTTLQAVGELAGYSRGLATHRFGSKAGLFGKVLQEASVDWLDRVQVAVGDRVGVDALMAATDAAEVFIRERPEEVRAMYLLWFLSIDPSAEYKSNIAIVHKAQRRDVAQWVKAGQTAGTVDPDLDPMRVAEQYAASMAGIIYQWLANSKMPLSSMFRQVKADLKIRLENKAPSETSKRQKAIRAV
ncbi:MAG: TetR/AcrR family transcriptional regulator [Gammaproteobacteria bacterium]